MNYYCVYTAFFAKDVRACIKSAAGWEGYVVYEYAAKRDFTYLINIKIPVLRTQLILELFSEEGE